jgi:hypothetical protein
MHQIRYFYVPLLSIDVWLVAVTAMTTLSIANFVSTYVLDLVELRLSLITLEVFDGT